MAVRTGGLQKGKVYSLTLKGQISFLWGKTQNGPLVLPNGAGFAGRNSVEANHVT